MSRRCSRHARIDSTIQQIIAPALVGLVRGGLVTVNSVEITPDLTLAKVYYTVIGADPAEVERKLDAMTSEFRRLLAKRLAAKRVPRLSFRLLPLDQPDLPCMAS